MGKSKLQNGSQPTSVAETIKSAKGKAEKVTKKAAESVVPEGKKKKKVKEPTPEPESESESDEESEDASANEEESDTSESSEADSSDDEKPAAKANTSKTLNGAADAKVNGSAKVVKSENMDVDSSESSESSDEEGLPAKFQPDSDASDSDEEEGDESSDEVANGTTAKAIPKAAAVKQDAKDDVSCILWSMRRRS